MNLKHLCKTLCLCFLFLAFGFSSSLLFSTHPSFAMSNTTSSKLIITGMNYLGRPYQFGASTNQTTTFDCSSFTQFVFKKNGLNLPRSSKEQARVGYYVPRNQLKKGDLIFFSVPGKPGIINHVAIYAGDNKILHTYGPGGVRFNSLSDGTLSQRYISARRL